MFRDINRRAPDRGDMVIMAKSSLLGSTSLEIDEVCGVANREGKSWIRLRSGTRITSRKYFRSSCMLIKEGE